MDLQVLLLAESLVTVRERAREGGRIVMLVRVVIKQDFRFKCFFTPVVRARKRLVAVWILNPARKSALA